jgi:putative component of membrane protein insertase Oxa1/YidC/SpoIIIJ protein YidD
MFKNGLIYLFFLIEKIKRFVFLNIFGYHIVCKHKPSCSLYFAKSIKEEGVFKGFFKSFIRIITCF